MWIESSNTHTFEGNLLLGCLQPAERETAGLGCYEYLDVDASALARASCAAVTEMVYW